MTTKYVAPPKDITEGTVEWAKKHDWFHSTYTTEDGHLAIWVKEGAKVHPWPFVNRQELFNWAGY